MKLTLKNLIPLTRTGYNKLVIELNNLKKVKRPEIAKEIGIAREHGDLSENAEYDAAREKQAHIEDRIIILENTIAKANIIDVDRLFGNKIMFGANVKLVNEETDEEVEYQIVGIFESDLTKGLISNSSPLGKALIGKEPGDSISFSAPSGDRYYEILEVEYKIE